MTEEAQDAEEQLDVKRANDARSVLKRRIGASARWRIVRNTDGTVSRRELWDAFKLLGQGHTWSDALAAAMETLDDAGVPR